jgi:hypothetical protein
MTTKMSTWKMAICVGVAGVLLFPSLSLAEIKWSNGARPYLEARSTEEESDASLRAICRNSQTIELRAGANEQVGEGDGKAVTLEFQSDGKKATLTGISKFSEDSEMTGGTELVTEVKDNDPIFSVLQTGKPVTITGFNDKKPVVWAAKGMKSAVAKFLKACG